VDTSIVIADSQRLIREGLRTILAAVPDFRVVGEAGDGYEAVSLAGIKRPDVVVIESQLPRLSGLSAVRQISQTSRSTACVMISTLHNPGLVKQAVGAGASAFVPKDAGAQDLVDAVRAVRSGRAYLAPHRAVPALGSLAATPDAEALPRHNLTARQSQVLRLIAEGFSSKQIAEELGISLKTAQTHRANLMSRVGVHKASSLVRYAIRVGIVSA